ncbi:DUF6168 family protein [Aquimarina brevivitae]|uniref:Uncharacterized protein n=1 Tax=Aquimarina brevivitae TaxID=323412 RepID=A0A4V2F7B7_9FLAO|nr:hypothetical protein EV197_0468 [Aquimarina brevivitae]
MQSRLAIQFILSLFVALGIAYGVHQSQLHHTALKTGFSLVHFSYLFNGIFTLITGLLIIFLSVKFKDYLGFIFLGSSTLKLAIFFGISKWLGFAIDKANFLEFFIAYVICLVLEIYFLSRLLNNLKY